MSIAEKVYLVMVVGMFVSFMILMATLSWLDAKDEKIRRHSPRQGAAKAKPAEIASSRVAAHQ